MLATDVERGFLLLSDLGSTTYLAALKDTATQAEELQRAANLYADALGSLAAIQCASRPGVLPEYFMALRWDGAPPQGEVAYHPAFTG